MPSTAAASLFLFESLSLILCSYPLVLVYVHISSPKNILYNILIFSTTFHVLPIINFCDRISCHACSILNLIWIEASEREERRQWLYFNFWKHPKKYCSVVFDTKEQGRSQKFFEEKFGGSGFFSHTYSIFGKVLNFFTIQISISRGVRTPPWLRPYERVMLLQLYSLYGRWKQN